jgi:hypothetical protein
VLPEVGQGTLRMRNELVVDGAQLYGRNVANSKNLRESGRGILTTDTPGHNFPAPLWPTPPRIQHTVYGRQAE